MRLLYMFPLSLLLLCSVQAGAGEKVLIGTPVSKSLSGQQEKKWYYPFEIGELSIKQSNNGTGIINDVSCPDCDYQFVKITHGTKVIVNGKKVNLLRARERAGKPVFIEFDKKTAEVKYIYWAE
ncbi:MAG: hypothetical protein JSW45_03850 [Thiotrichales bacterium]|nr:MAG: hypothetical protein JSW45_03850 [Thiotrichales bacterium]